MKILLSPNSTDPDALRKVYNQAVQEAEEIYLATAYLMDWSGIGRVDSSCKRLVFLVGVDFGLTRKAAMRSVLKWMPSGQSHFYGAVLTDGFHPKIAAWKTHAGEYYCLAGSSNLTKAGLSLNYEANMFSRVTVDEFKKVKRWFDSIIGDHAVPANIDYINNHYTEAKQTSGRSGHRTSLQLKLLPKGTACRKQVVGRREQQERFKEIGKQIRAEASRCVAGELTNFQFWKRFWDLWAHHPSRFQGSGLQFTGKSANWQQACAALLRVLEASKNTTKAELDRVVAAEIDELKNASNPCRGAWLSEMLCHYFPELYPINNAPVRTWLRENKWRTNRRDATEGQKYTDLARQLRFVVSKHRPAGAHNLAELDAAIWRWVHDNVK
jgi:hypothetical protein